MSLRMHNFGGSMRSHLPSAMFISGMHSEGDGHALHQPVLVLNASYEPINVCAARRAIVLVLKGVAMTEEENGHFLHAARVAMRVPSVIRLLEYRRIPHQSSAGYLPGHRWIFFHRRQGLHGTSLATARRWCGADSASIAISSPHSCSVSTGRYRLFSTRRNSFSLSF